MADSPVVGVKDVAVEGVPPPSKRDNESYKKRSRENTEQEKKAMKRARKKRKRSMKLKELKAEVDIQKNLKESAVRSHIKYVGMSRTYWERWRWELQERRQLLISQRMASRSLPPLVEFVLPCIDPAMLKDPLINGEHKECYVGRGSFGIVRLCTFRDIPVAVKEFLPRTVHEDVSNEAHILASLCHPYLPCLLGVCMKGTPLRIVMQFHGSDGKATTLFQELRDKKLNCSESAFSFCAQLMEAVQYLHHEVEILHNDITTNNIVIEKDHIVLIDFSKATKLSEAKHYQLGETEKQEYIAKYPPFGT